MNLEKLEPFLDGGGEMGALTRAFDWSASSLGPARDWPQSLRLTIRLMLNSQHPMFIWWGPELIQFYNDAYRQTMGPEMHPSALGARGRETWADIWLIIGPQIDMVMAGEGATWNVEQMVPIHRHGRREDVWWTYGYSPIDLDNGVGGVLVVCNDVTERHLATEALKDRTRRLSEQFEQAPGFIATLRGPEHVFELTNAAYRKLVGNRDILGKPVREAIPEVDGQGYFELLDEVYRTGKAFVGRRTPIALQADPSQPMERSFLDFVYQAIFEPNGSVSGIFVEGQDVTDHVVAEQRLALINEELKHRVKNTLAMVSAVASQSLRKAAGAEAMKIFDGRLAAFGAAHDSLTAASEPTATVAGVVDGALLPYRAGEGRFSISGPDVTIGSKQALSLAMAVHELATNAVKYGALSNQDGRVEFNWRIDPVDSSIFQLVWEEKGGPLVTAPIRKGFGSRLIKTILAADFDGTVDISYEPTGVICRLSGKVEY